MFLNIERQISDRIAVKDNDKNTLTYNELIIEIKKLSDFTIPRSIVFVLCKNTIGSLLGYMGFIERESAFASLELLQYLGKNLETFQKS